MISFNKPFAVIFELLPVIDDFPVVRAASVSKCINLTHTYTLVKCILADIHHWNQVLNTTEYFSNWT